jgi:hypothetical protein
MRRSAGSDGYQGFEGPFVARSIAWSIRLPCRWHSIAATGDFAPESFGRIACSVRPAALRQGGRESASISRRRPRCFPWPPLPRTLRQQRRSHRRPKPVAGRASQRRFSRRPSWESTVGGLLPPQPSIPSFQQNRSRLAREADFLCLQGAEPLLVRRAPSSTAWRCPGPDRWFSTRLRVSFRPAAWCWPTSARTTRSASLLR